MAGISSIMPRQHGIPVRCPWRSPVLPGGQERSVPYRIRTEPSNESLMLDQIIAYGLCLCSLRNGP